MVKKITEITYNLSPNWMANHSMSRQEIEGHFMFLIEIFASRYLRLFPAEVSDAHADRLLHISRILYEIRKLEGFDRHIAGYDKVGINNHLYCAQVAAFLKKHNFKIALEPIVPPGNAGIPDLFIETVEGGAFFGECKNLLIDNLFNFEKKRRLADVIYSTIQTCDQIDILSDVALDYARVTQLLKDPQLASPIYGLYDRSKPRKQTRFPLTEDTLVQVVQQEAIIGGEDNFITGHFEGYLQDKDTGLRRVGYQFLRGGRSIGVYDVVTDFSKKLKDKREKSAKQLIEGYPNLVFVNGANVVGAPEGHKDYLIGHWLTADNDRCNGVDFLGFYRSIDGSPEYTLELFTNGQAKIQYTFDDVSKLSRAIGDPKD